MGHFLEKCIFLLILMKIGQLQSAPLLSGCSCGKAALPLPVTFPVAPPALEVPCATHGYKIEIPAPPVLKAATLSYAMDVVVEAPVPAAPAVVCNPNLVTTAVLNKAALLSPDCDPPAAALLPAPAPAPPAIGAPCGLAALPTAPALALAAPAPAPLLAAPAPALPLALNPALLALNPALLALLQPSLAALPAALPDDFSGVAPLQAPAPPKVTYEIISSGRPAIPLGPLPGAYSLDLSPPAPPCACAAALKPSCRYVSKDTKSNSIDRGRSKREVCSKNQQLMEELKNYLKSLTTTRVTRKAKKSKLVKRDIKGEYDLLQREQSEMDLTIPEIIQYMPETMMPNFKRGKCNIGCKNCIHNDSKGHFKKIQSHQQQTDSINKNAYNIDQQSTEQQQQSKQQVLNENTTELPIQQFDVSPQRQRSAASAAGEHYFYDKRSVNPFQSPNPSYSGLLPPPYMSSTMELTKLAQNPVNPVWFEPQPLIDPNTEYVYDRLGHKYKVKNGSFQLVKPELNDDGNDRVEVEVNSSSAHVASVENTEDTTDADKIFESSALNSQEQHEEAKKLYDSAIQQQDFTDANASPEPKMIQVPSPTVGAPARHRDPSYDPHMDKVIRDIVYQHPDFIEATQHAPGSLTLPEEVTRDETMQFLDKLIRGRFSKWFGSPSEQVSMPNLDDLNRFSRETGTTVKFIPIVTVDRDRLDMYRQSQIKAEETTQTQ
ncbi:uncharacterized protein LOC129909574 [Episyrphus balteatus]|uniref:uncharacterized protein LOC129909574 n=1 Tax=Episyrphus balteatus TaxID=286459 RepID=UPI002485DAB0|nr:uncharacterized protein LOC129909574 [Episyrphus balteatus]